MMEKECVAAAITHHETKAIPYTLDFSGAGEEKIAAFCDKNDFYSKLGNYINLIFYSSLLDMKNEVYMDCFGVKWEKNSQDQNSPDIVEYAIPEPALKGFAAPKFNEVQLRTLIEKNLDRYPEKFNLFTIDLSLFSRACALCGKENMLNYMSMEPKFTERLFVVLCEYNIRLIDIALEYNIDGIYFVDDWRCNKEMMMENVHWRKYIKPQLQRMYERVKRKGKFIFQHSPGNIEQIFPDLTEIGLDVYHPLQSGVYDFEKIKTQFGMILSFWGGIPSRLLEKKTDPEKIQKKVKETLELMSRNGGFIAAPDEPLSPGVPAQNLLTVLTAIERTEPNEQRFALIHKLGKKVKENNEAAIFNEGNICHDKK